MCCVFEIASSFLMLNCFLGEVVFDWLLFVVCFVLCCWLFLGGELFFVLNCVCQLVLGIVFKIVSWGVWFLEVLLLFFCFWNCVFFVWMFVDCLGFLCCWICLGMFFLFLKFLLLLGIFCF